MIGKHLSTYKINKIVLCFCEDITASSTAKIVGVNRNTINAYFNEFRKLIFNEELRVVGKETGIFEVDESYFGARRVRGKRGRGAAGKTPVFGLLKRGEKVYVQIIPNCSRENILPIIEGKVTSGSVIHSDGWKAYDGINLNGYEHHRVFHSENEFARGKCHINGIENFWSFAKRRSSKFNGCKSDKFVLHLKECEWRYNHKNENLVKLLKELLAKN